VALALALGCLTVPDGAVLQLGARLSALVDSCVAKRHEHGESVIRRDDRGTVVAITVAPWVKVELQAAAQLKSVLEQLGLSPASRSRVQVAPPHGEDAFSEFDNVKQFQAAAPRLREVGK
jgi:phage terminase small subunit